MVFANLRREERIGLGIALVLHVALAVAFLAQPTRRAVIPSEQKMTVNLSTDVGLEATAPEPVPESAAAMAPILAPEPALPSEPLPQPAVARPIERPQPVATAVPRPKPVERPSAQPRPKPPATSSDPRRRPDAPSSQTRSQPKPPARPAGGSRIGADFLPGAGSSTTSRETRAPASQIGASAKASLAQAIAREIKPKWSSPQGPDVEQLVTYLTFNLNPDGSLAGTPRVVKQDGINDTNRAQASRHAEQAIRAVQLAAPFDLPDEYYNAWKRVSSFRFDRKL